MLKMIFWGAALAAVGAILRRTNILNNLKTTLFDKVDAVTGSEGTGSSGSYSQGTTSKANQYSTGY
jgi:hypothetical protein